MSERTPTSTGAPGGTAPGDWDDESLLPVDEVRELFTTLGKALRAYQLYDENNPVRHRFVGALRQAFGGLWEEVDRLAVNVEEERIVWMDQEVHRAEKSGGDSLAFLFYRDGIREVVFLPGIENGEMEAFLAIIQKARRLKGEGDDLLTLLWDADLEHLRYQYVDLLAEGLDLPGGGNGATAPELEEVLEEEGVQKGESAGAEPPSAKVNPADFNPTLYSLDPHELETLRGEVEKEMERDLRRDVLNALFDRLEEPEFPDRQLDILNILRTLLPNFLSHGELHAASRVLGEIGKLRGREGVLGAEGQKVAERLLRDAGGPDALRELVRALADGTLSPSPGELADFLRHLRTEALAPLLRAVESIEDRKLRGTLAEAIGEIARKRPADLTGLLEHEDPVIVRGAVRLIGEIGLSDAGPALGRVLSHPDRDVRLVAVEAARALRASSAAGPLVNALTDSDDDVRAAAARAVGALGYRPALGALRSRVKGKEIRDAHRTEKIAFFEAYGLVGGTEAVKELDQILNGRGFLGRKEPEEIRAAAALALGKVGTPGAKEALQKATGEEDAVVRAAVSRALRGGEAEA